MSECLAGCFDYVAAVVSISVFCGDLCAHHHCSEFGYLPHFNNSVIYYLRRFGSFCSCYSHSNSSTTSTIAMRFNP